MTTSLGARRTCAPAFGRLLCCAGCGAGLRLLSCILMRQLLLLMRQLLMLMVQLLMLMLQLLLLMSLRSP